MSIFDEIKAGGETAIRGLIGRQETLDFDCKLKDGRAPAKLSDDDKENLTKTLSAFCNSAGGVLLWGVNARRNDATNCDEIVGFEPIKNVEAIAEQMKRIWAERIMPRLDEVETEVIKCANDRSEGFIVMRVERSERRPHRCEVTKLYWRRVADSSRSMEHYEIEDAFRRLTVPELEVTNHVIAGGMVLPSESRIGSAEADMVISLKNVSNVSARFPYLQISSNAQPRNLPTLTGLKLNDGSYQFEGGADVVIHPGMSREMGQVSIPIQLRLVQLRLAPYTEVQADAMQVRNRSLNVAFGCLNSPFTRRNVEIKFESFKEAFPHVRFV